MTATSNGAGLGRVGDGPVTGVERPLQLARRRRRRRRSCRPAGPRPARATPRGPRRRSRPRPRASPPAGPRSPGPTMSTRAVRSSMRASRPSASSCGVGAAGRGRRGRRSSSGLLVGGVLPGAALRSVGRHGPGTSRGCAPGRRRTSRRARSPGRARAALMSACEWRTSPGRGSTWSGVTATPDLGGQDVQQLEQRRRPAAGHVVGPAGALLGGRRAARRLACTASATKVKSRLWRPSPCTEGRRPVEQRVDEQRDDRRVLAVGPLPGAEHVEVPQADGLEAVQLVEHPGVVLAGELGDRVRRPGHQRRRLGRGHLRRRRRRPRTTTP